MEVVFVLDFRLNRALLLLFRLVSECNERDFDSLRSDADGYKPIVQLTCKKLILQDNTQYPNCKYGDHSTPSEQCLHVCRRFTIGVGSKQSQTQKCFCCDRPSVRVRRSSRRKQTANVASTVVPRNITQQLNNTTFTRGPLKNVIAVGGLSILAFLINFVVMVKLCCSPLTVIDLFATALFFFNVILSLYGLSMGFYLFYPSLEKYTWYCQFFTSIKLFSLGSSLYTMVFLMFHRPIRRSSGESGRDEMEEGKKKAAKRDAIFKGIVFLLEAVMLAGVLSVLSWIKTRNWRKMCVIITPYGSVEGLLHGIEVWYIVLSGMLVSWYFGNYLYRKYKILKAYREKLKRQEEEEDDMDNGVCDEPDEPEIAPYIIRDFPIFILIAISFTVWLAGLIISSPGYSYTTSETAPIARICSLILPIIIQPFVYVIRDTWLFKCFCCRQGKHRTNTVEEIKLNKSPSDDSQGSQEASNNNLELTPLDNTGAPQPPIAKVEQTDQSDDDDASENDPLNKKTKSNDFEVPKVVCRSPAGERTRLLDDTDGKQEPPTIIVGGPEEETSKATLTNNEEDTDIEGRVSRGPTFYPIAEKAAGAGGAKPAVEFKSYTPIKEDTAGEEVKVSNGKEKRKDKINKLNSAGSTGSRDLSSDSSSSHDGTPSDSKTSQKTGTEWDPDRFEGKQSPTDNTNENAIDQIIPINTSVGESNVGPKSETNHTGKGLNKPILTRDNSGSVER